MAKLGDLGIPFNFLTRAFSSDSAEVFSGVVNNRSYVFIVYHNLDMSAYPEAIHAMLNAASELKQEKGQLVTLVSVSTMSGLPAIKGNILATMKRLSQAFRDAADKQETIKKVFVLINFGPGLNLFADSAMRLAFREWHSIMGSDWISVEQQLASFV